MKRDWWKKGFVYAEILVVAALVSSVSYGTYQAARKGDEAACQNNLKQIYLALYEFQAESGTLPNAAFFPRSPSDPKGINNILKGVLSGNTAVFFCSSVPHELNKYGTNYIWNDTVSGKSLDGIPGNTWLMTEMSSVVKDIPPPHIKGYQTLYADGTVTVGPRVNFPVAVPSSEPKPAPSLAKQPPEPEIKPAPAEPLVKVRVENLPEKAVAGKFRMKIAGYDESGKVIPVDRTVSIADLNESIQPETILLSQGIWEGVIPFSRSVQGDTILFVDEKGTFSTATVDVVAGPPAAVKIYLQNENLRAGESFEARVLVEDEFGNTCRDWEGKLVPESSDPEARMPKELALDKKDAGGKNLPATFFKAGSQKIKITASGDSGRQISGEKVFAINPGAADHFSIDKINSPKIAGEPFNIFIRSEDRWGNAVKGPYLSDTTGTLKLSRENYSSGISVEEVLVIKAAKEAVLTVDDGNGHIGKSNPFEVKPAVPAALGLEGVPRVVAAGQEYKLKVVFSDRYGNAIPDYPGEVELSSSDKDFRSSAAALSVSFATPGKQTLTVKDKKTGFTLNWVVLVATQQ